VPERRPTPADAEELTRLTWAVGIDGLVVGGGPLAAETEQCDDQLRAEEARRRHPTIIERVQERAEVDTRHLDAQLNQPAVGPITLAGQEAEIVTQQMGGDPLDRVRRTLRGKRPLRRAEPTEHRQQGLSLRAQHIEQDSDRRSVDHVPFLHHLTLH
jgi:hypothetical protein